MRVKRNCYRARIKPKVMISPKARHEAQAKNIVSKLLIPATNPIAVAPTAKPPWNKHAVILMDTPLAFAGDRSATRARLAGAAIPIPAPKKMAAMINGNRLWNWGMKAVDTALVIKPQIIIGFLPTLSDNLPAGTRNRAELA